MSKLSEGQLVVVTQAWERDYQGMTGHVVNVLQGIARVRLSGPAENELQEEWIGKVVQGPDTWFREVQEEPPLDSGTFAFAGIYPDVTLKDLEQARELVSPSPFADHSPEQLQEIQESLWETRDALTEVEHETTHCLDQAKNLVCGERARAYGPPSESFARLSAMISAYLGVEVPPRKVAGLMILLKLSRDAHAPQPDNVIDIAGYAQLMAWLP